MLALTFAPLALLAIVANADATNVKDHIIYESSILVGTGHLTKSTDVVLSPGKPNNGKCERQMDLRKITGCPLKVVEATISGEFKAPANLQLENNLMLPVLTVTWQEAKSRMCQKQKVHVQYTCAWLRRSDPTDEDVSALDD